MIGQTIHQFKIEALAGEGGMGVVYRALDTRLGRPVALKFLRREQTHSPEARRRFLREARAAARLSHPAVATVYDIIEHGDQLVIVSEWVDGETFEALEFRSPESWPDLITLLLQVADGLDAAHAVGIIHRDVKPSNILVTKNRQVKICDFGVARISGTTTITLADSQMTGTPERMAPEQWQGLGIDHRIDIFALGTLTYEMLTGQPPFRADEFAAIGYAIVNEPQTPPSERNSDLPDTADAAIGAALAKDPNERPSSCSDYVKTLENSLCLSAGRSGSSSDTVKRGKRSSVIALAMVVITLLAAGIAHWLQGGSVLSLADEAVAAVQAAHPDRPPKLVIPPTLPDTRDESVASSAAGFGNALYRALRDRSGFDILDMPERTPSEDLPDWGALQRQTGADFYLESSLTGTSDDTECSVRLLQLPEGEAVWSKTYPGVSQVAILSLPGQVMSDLTSAVAWSGQAPSADLSSQVLFSPSVRKWLNRGHRMMELKEYGIAHEMYDSALAASNDQIVIRYWIGKAMAAKGLHDEAIREFKLAMSDAPVENIYIWDTTLAMRQSDTDLRWGSRRRTPVLTILVESPTTGVYRSSLVDPSRRAVRTHESTYEDGLPVFYFGDMALDGWTMAFSVPPDNQRASLKILDADGVVLGTTPEVPLDNSSFFTRWLGDLLLYPAGDSLTVFDSSGTQLGVLPARQSQRLRRVADQLWAVQPSLIHRYSLRPLEFLDSVRVEQRIGAIRVIGGFMVAITGDGTLTVMDGKTGHIVETIPLPDTTESWNLRDTTDDGPLILTSDRHVWAGTLSQRDGSVEQLWISHHKVLIVIQATADSLWITERTGHAYLHDLNSGKKLRELRLWHEARFGAEDRWQSPEFYSTDDGVLVVSREQIAKFGKAGLKPRWVRRFNETLSTTVYLPRRAMICCLTADDNLYYLSESSGRILLRRRWKNEHAGISSFGQHDRVFTTVGSIGRSVPEYRAAELDLDIPSYPVTRTEIQTELGHSMLASDRYGEATTWFRAALDHGRRGATRLYRGLLDSYLLRDRTDSALLVAVDWDEFAGTADDEMSQFRRIITEHLDGAVYSARRGWPLRDSDTWQTRFWQLASVGSEVVLVAPSAGVFVAPTSDCNGSVYDQPGGVELVHSRDSGPYLATVSDFESQGGGSGGGSPIGERYPAAITVSVWNVPGCDSLWSVQFKRPETNPHVFRSCTWIANSRYLVVSIPSTNTPGITENSPISTNSGFVWSWQDLGDTVVNTTLHTHVYDIRSGETISDLVVRGPLRFSHATVSTQEETYTTMKYPKNIMCAGRYLVALFGDSLHSVDLERGIVNGRRLGIDSVGQFKVDGDHILITAEDGRLLNIDPASLRTRWQIEDATWSLRVFGDTIVTLSADTVRAYLPPIDGTHRPRLLWQIVLDPSPTELHSFLGLHQIGSAVLVRSKNLSTSDKYEILTLIDLRTGKKLVNASVPFELRRVVITPTHFFGLTHGGTLFSASLAKLTPPPRPVQ